MSWLTKLSSFVALVLFIIGVAAAAALAQQPTEYRGTLDSKLVAHTAPWYVLSKLRAATDEERGRVKIDLTADDRVSVVDVTPLAKGLEIKAVLVERSGRPFAVLVDVDRDGTWTRKECPPLAPSDDALDSPGSVVARFDVPLPDGYAYNSYPLAMMVSRDERPDQSMGPVMLLQSSGVAAQGLVDIDGRKTLVRYTGVNLRTGTVDPTARWVEVDCDGNGAINTVWDSPENSLANGRAVVFRVGSRYVSTASVDTATRTIVMRDHAASDYERIELSVGFQVPDFRFTDFDGKDRKLSEFRGKYLMLDFWGSWCGPCISRFPALKDIYAKYQARGFEILGMDKENWEGDQSGPAIEKARSVIADKALPWPQTRPDTVKSIIDRFHIVPYPTYVLLDPQGKVVSWGAKGQLPLDGPALATTLDRVLTK